MHPSSCPLGFQYLPQSDGIDLQLCHRCHFPSHALHKSQVIRYQIIQCSNSYIAITLMSRMNLLKLNECTCITSIMEVYSIQGQTLRY